MTKREMIGSNKTETARHLDISVRHLNRLITDGVLPAMPAEGFDLDQIRPLYIRRLRSIAGGRDNADLSAARAHLARLQASRVELQTAILSNRFVEVEHVGRHAEDAYAEFSDKGYAIPPLAARECVGLDEPGIRKVLDRYVGDMLTALRIPYTLIEAESRKIGSENFSEANGQQQIDNKGKPK